MLLVLLKLNSVMQRLRHLVAVVGSAARVLCTFICMRYENTSYMQKWKKSNVQGQLHQDHKSPVTFNLFNEQWIIVWYLTVTKKCIEFPWGIKLPGMNSEATLPPPPQPPPRTSLVPMIVTPDQGPLPGLKFSYAILANSILNPNLMFNLISPLSNLFRQYYLCLGSASGVMFNLYSASPTCHVILIIQLSLNDIDIRD